MNNSLALLEINGLCASISTVDTLLKNSSAEIELEEIKNGKILLKLKGNIPQIKYSLNLAIETVNKISSVGNFTVLEKLNPSIEREFFNKTKNLQTTLFQTEIETERKPKTTNKEELNGKKSENVRIRKVKKTATKAISKPKQEVHTSEKSDVNLSTIERPYLEVLGEKIVTERETRLVKPKVVSSYLVEKLSDLEGLNVHKLRRVARDFEEFPIKGREISIANRDKLMSYFKQILPE